MAIYDSLNFLKYILIIYYNAHIVNIEIINMLTFSANLLY